jgi:phytoene dehydrogenase-like protein
MKNQADADVLIIGSGIGALTCGAILAKVYQKRVLILEQHYEPGGFTHSFSRQHKWTWDVGLHYLGSLEPGGSTWRMIRFLTEGRLKFEAMPYRFDHFVYPGFRYAQPAHPVQFQYELEDLFPNEQAAIAQYFEDLKAASSWYSKHIVGDFAPDVVAGPVNLLAWFSRKWGRMTTSEYLNSHFQNPQLRALLASQWGDYGLPPHASSFATHAIVVSHYLYGGWYPVGGGRAIYEAFAPTIEAAGGEIRTRHRVEEILIEDGAAVGVRVAVERGKLETETQFFAPQIVSDAGAATTYLKLIPESVPIAFRERIRNLRGQRSVVSLYIGFHSNPMRLGLRGENYWIFSGTDHDAMEAAQWERLLEGDPQFVYLSFPSLKEPHAQHHTAEVIAFCSSEAFARWRDTEWKHRGQEYDALKERITQGLIRFIERTLPGLAELIEYTELATPLTIEHFSGHAGGAIYGLPATPERLAFEEIGVNTPIRNLYLTGTDAATMGVLGGAMMGGIATASVLGGATGFFKVFGALQG